jgi:hypothetical protein
LGIDFGVANCALVGFSPQHGMVHAWKPREEKIPPGVRRLSYLIHTIKGQLDMVTKKGDVKMIALEGYSMAERYGQHNPVRLWLSSWPWSAGSGCREVAYPVIVAPQQLKKFVSGNGNTKEALWSRRSSRGGAPTSTAEPG